MNGLNVITEHVSTYYNGDSNIQYLAFSLRRGARIYVVTFWHDTEKGTCVRAPCVHRCNPQRDVRTRPMRSALLEYGRTLLDKTIAAWEALPHHESERARSDAC